MIVETLADVLGRGKTAVAPAIAREQDDPLTLLIYTSGSTGAPKGAMHPERLVANYVAQDDRGDVGSDAVPSRRSRSTSCR